jgi:hypothetical protein
VGRGKNEALVGTRKQVPLVAKILTSFFPPMIAFWTLDKSDYFRSSIQVAANSGLPMTDYKGYNRVHEPMQGVDGSQGAGGPTMDCRKTRPPSPIPETWIGVLATSDWT